MLEADNISVSYGKRSLFSDVSLTFERGKLYGIYGASECGKTTFARILAGLQKPSTGTVAINGQKFSSLKHWSVQYLFQNPLHAMNSRWKINRILEESGPLSPAHTKSLGVADEWMERFPHELSGGQLQRISILRALGANPDYLIADETTAALDPIAQAQIWYFLEHLVYEHDMAILAISHDLELLNRLTPAENCIDFSAL